MDRLLLCIIWVILPALLLAQSTKDSRSIDSREIEPGVVWVKVKEEFLSQFVRQNGRGRLGSLPENLEITPLLKSKSHEKAGARNGPRRMHIDISRYFRIMVDRGVSVEAEIARLMATGYFEVVEPVERISLLFTPDDPSLSDQYYLDLIRAEEAWDITTGSESLVIGIVDTGGDLNHPDLVANIYIDPAEPIDGLDNDGDGYIDNNRGWDFSGSDASLIGTPGFLGDNDPSVSQGGIFSHGTKVGGCAAATVNNGIGVAGIGYKTKLLFTKHFADNQSPASTNFTSNAYEGVLYAATHGAKIINCSWGSYNKSTIAQDIIEYVTLDLGCLVVAAGGNSNLEVPIYPAGYDHVVAVANTNSADVRAPFSNFGQYIDLTAPGVSIYSTAYDDGYDFDSGTSFSCPLVAGAAALVWSQHPEWTPSQVGEQLRVTADESIYENNPDYLFKLGKGRLDVAQALTQESPSVRAGHQVFLNDDGEVPKPGEVGKLVFDFTNYLQASTGALTASISSASPYITILENTVQLGVIPQNSTVTNTDVPFEIELSLLLPIDLAIPLVVTFTDEDYSDFQLVSIVIPSYIDIDDNNILTSLTSSGRIGFGNVDAQSGGSGFNYDEDRLLFEMGIVMGTSESFLFNNVRGVDGSTDNDFIQTAPFHRMSPGQRSYAEITASLADTVESGSLEISYQSMVWNNNPYRDFIILEYTVKNAADQAITDFYFGLFADWDIDAGGGADHATWDNVSNLGFVVPVQNANLPRAGIQVLSGTPQYFAIDNDPGIPGNPFGVYDGFTDQEKFTAISSGLAKTEAGDPDIGGDVSHVVASGPYQIEAGGSVKIAFALHASPTTASILNSARYADTLYNYTLQAPKPEAASVAACEGSSATLEATGASNYKWYKSFTGGMPVATGPTLNLPPLSRDTAMYVSNADNPYESVRAKATVKVVGPPQIQAAGNLAICDGESVTLSVDEADGYTWSNGETTQTISATVAGEYRVTVHVLNASCEAATPAIVDVKPSPTVSITVDPENPSPLEPISFVGVSAENVTWFWDFGDGETSVESNPFHSYLNEGDVSVVVTATGDNGCQTSLTKDLGIITGVESGAGSTVALYPNPIVDGQLRISGLGNKLFQVTLYDVQGRSLFRRTYRESALIDARGLNSGEYFLVITVDGQKIIRKILVAR